jgi:Acetylornithine deacetylase/Succinyl-diaminopimelate desuccinylase and related deacylases
LPTDASGVAAQWIARTLFFAAFQAVDELCAEDYIPEYDVYIASSDSEEVFGEGAPRLKDYLKENGVKPYIVLDEGGAILAQAFPGMIKPYAMVGVLEKGYADFKFTAKSKGGHSSSPPKNSPIARLSAFVNEVENSKFFKKKMAPEAKEMLSKMAGGLTGPLKTVLGNIGLFKPLIMGVLPKASPFGRALLSTTCVFTMAGGSEAPNVIPQEAYVIANLRFAPHQGVDACTAYFKKLCIKYDLEMETLEAHDALPPVSTKSEGYKHLTKTIEKCFPEVGIAPYVIIGGTDCRYFQEICDCAMRFAPMLLEPDQLASMHSSNESLNVAELGKGIAFMKELIKTNI